VTVVVGLELALVELPDLESVLFQYHEEGRDRKNTGV
jgi:hypothetical protein